jgi:hypothetical protein
MRLFSLINFIIFQLSWFLSATYKESAIPIISLLLCIHFLCSNQKKADLAILPIALIGITVDQLLMILHIIEIPQGTTNSLMVPIWLMLLWCVFSWSFNHSLRWVNNLSLCKVSCLGAIFGTLSYYAALKLAVFNTLLPHAYFIVIMAIIWSILLPLFTRVHALMVKEVEL